MKNSTDITILLDRSGSMCSIKSSIIEGLNYFIKKQQELKDESCRLSLIQFDSENPMELLLNAVDINLVNVLTDADFVPRGMTPLLDCIGRTILMTQNRIDNNKPAKILFVIITDGEENSSVEYNRDQIFKIIEDKRHEMWDFIFMGANQDSIASGNKIGISADTSYNFNTTSKSIKTSFITLGDKTTKYRSDKSSNYSNNIIYNSADRNQILDDNNEA